MIGTLPAAFTVTDERARGLRLAVGDGDADGLEPGRRAAVGVDQRAVRREGHRVGRRRPMHRSRTSGRRPGRPSRRGPASSRGRPDDRRLGWLHLDAAALFSPGVAHGHRHGRATPYRHDHR